MSKKVILSKKNQAIIQAFEKGYRVDVLGNITYRARVLNLCKSSFGYFLFSVRVVINGEKSLKQVLVHRLQAYQKFGNVIFTEGVCVRHKDGDCKNNSIENIILGNHSDNMMDKSPEVRMKTAIYASSFMKKHNHEEIIKLHNEGKSYAEIMKILGTKSKGTISFIIKESIASKINQSENQ